MTVTLTLEIGRRTTRCTIDTVPPTHDLPIGLDTLGGQWHTPTAPPPEDLTNAIGMVVDSLDDLVREAPAALDAHVVLHAPVMAAIAAVEVGHDVPPPYRLDRGAAEDVFRTVVTESAADRALNPGLPAELVTDVVPAACIVVGVMRFLHLDAVDLGW